MNTKIGHCNLKPFVTLNCEDLEFSSEGVSVVSCQISMFRHETGSCYNSGSENLEFSLKGVANFDVSP